MEMTEKMKQDPEEYMKKEGVELSEEELEGIAGGKNMDEDLRCQLWKQKSESPSEEPKFEWGIDYHLPWAENYEE